MLKTQVRSLGWEDPTILWRNNWVSKIIILVLWVLELTNLGESLCVIVTNVFMSDSLWPCGLQHARLLCPSLSPWVCSNSCPSSWWCHATLILCCPLLLLHSIFPSIRVFSNESAFPIRRPKYWSSSFSISPSNEHPGLISFRIDWSDLLAVQGTLRSLLQHHSSKASVLRCSAFFMVHISRLFRTIGKTIALLQAHVGYVVLSKTRHVHPSKWHVPAKVATQGGLVV